MDLDPMSVRDAPPVPCAPTGGGTGFDPEPMLVRGRRSLPCAACGDRADVQPDPQCGGVPFCAECRDRARHLSEWDDLGIGD